MKLLILTQKMDSNDPILGFFHRWVEEFARQCESIIVICLFEGAHALPKNVRVLSLGKEGGVSRFKYLRRFFTYIWRERKEYDAVYVHMNQIYVILGAWVWRILGKTVSWWYAHGSTSVSMRVAEKLTQIVFTSSPQGFRLRSGKVHVVGQGIDTELFKPAAEKKHDESLNIVCVGRIGPVKHLDLLVRALSIVLKTRPQAELYLYGSPQTDDERAYQKEIEQLVREEGLQDKVHFPGAIVYTDLPRVLADADVFAQASQTGSLDKAVLEALAMNIPAVSTNEAFRNFPGVLHVHASAEQIADGILRITQMENVREYVVEHHSLASLVAQKTVLLKCP